MKYFLRRSKAIKDGVRTRSMASMEQQDQGSGSKRKRSHKHDQLRMQKSKRSRASNHENGVDYISNMPDPILHLILQRLPTIEEAVRTTILATRWRYLGTSIPSVDIDFRAREKFGKTKFRQFVNSVLTNKTGISLDSLRLDCGGNFDMTTVRRWIKAAVKRKVKRLDLMFFSCEVKCDSIPLPDCLLTCESLKELRLFPYRCAMHLPESTGFRALRVLELHLIYSYDLNLVEKILEKCPVLEELRLIDNAIVQVDPICISSPKLKTLIILYRENIIYGHNGTWCGVKVCCPELVSFEFVGHRGHLIFENVDRLKKAVILPNDVMQQEISFELGDTGCKMLDKISHVESLKLNLYFIQCIDVAGDRVHAYFKNLKTLEITTTIDHFTMNALIWILGSSPNLESLHLIIQEEQLRTEYWATNEVETWKILTSHLKTVKFLGFDGEKQKCDIACCLLEHGKALEEMVFIWCNTVTYHEKAMKLMNELSEFNKASSSMKLISVLKDQ
ncbi:F-box domain, FBD domain, Leucine-rich repeat domain, L domain-like protein [Artemisia annua]|uniref:F-box domain, FBD domain, Leucine-rich repeat domain, L domain-like protein n=1 Tax=Artemisia annua TaxID=35608 RepID=A0A2U1M320_ARTAN|nr:F-box domain, FBD domain, Leucine-rich repeat domain, L domain-like protein [Artemisia annua]